VEQRLSVEFTFDKWVLHISNMPKMFKVRRMRMQTSSRH